MTEKVYNKNKIETSIIGRIFVDFSAQPIHDHSKKKFVLRKKLSIYIREVTIIRKML